jgi:hypothetical protein
MKKSLLATVAAVALIAGTGLVSAETAKEQPGMKAGAAVKAEPEMKKGADIKSGAEVKGKATTTGAGVESKSEMKAEPKADVKADSKADVKTDTKANADKAKPSTSGQASDQKAAPAAKSSADTPAAKSTTTEKAAPAAGSTTQTTQSPAAKSTTQSQTSAPASAQTGASVTLTTEQKSQIRTSVLQSSSAPKMSRSQINFSINIGTTVPRSVRFVTVPSTLVEIHPAWRGYSYFIVDDEIIIVEPNTLRIVAVLSV